MSVHEDEDEAPDFPEDFGDMVMVDEIGSDEDDTIAQDKTDSTVKEQNDSPITVPNDSAIKPPTDSPIKAPTDSPIKAPTDSPIKTPTEGSIKAPTDSPIKPPADHQMKAPTEVLVKAPTDLPMKAPTETSIKAPTEVPIKDPTEAPIKDPTDQEVVRIKKEPQDHANIIKSGTSEKSGSGQQSQKSQNHANIIKSGTSEKSGSGQQSQPIMIESLKKELTLFDLVSDCDQWQDRIAVVYDDRQMTVTMTYNQVMIIAGKISSLIAGQTEPPDVIGLCLEPNQFVPAVLIGVLKSGNAFLNFTASGIGYLQNVLEQLKVNILFIQSSNLKALELLLFQHVQYDTEIIHSDILQDLDIVLVKLNRPQLPKTERTYLAYCITTSGTTGTPKIVKVPHSCIVPNILYQRSSFRISQEDVVFLSSPLTFDPSIVDIFVTLSSGSCLLMTSDAMKAVPNKLLWLLTKYHVSVVQCTPTLLSRFRDLQTSLLSEYSPLRVIGLGGEQFPPLSYLRHWRAPRNRTKFYNLYGITEVSCWSSIYEVTESDFREVKEDVPIGKPMIDTEYIVKDDNGKVIKNGQGYLYIGSLNRVCFLNHEDPVQAVQGKVLRPTGDLVNINSQGQILYIGRTDNQIKRHGKRIDLKEIEKVVCRAKRIKTCKILYKDSILVAVVVERSDNATMSFVNLVSEVRAQIEHCLPSHCWLDNVVKTENIPMTNHGKCDVEALWRIVQANSESLDGSKETQKDMEKYLTKVWKEILVIEGEVKEEAMFIFSGGNSVQAVQLANQIQADLNIQLPWLLDFILNKLFGEIIKEIMLTIGNEGDTVEIDKIPNKNLVIPFFTKEGSDCDNLDNINVAMETTDTFDLHKISRKRKISDIEKIYKEQHSPGNDLIKKNVCKKKTDVSSLNLTPIKCKMKCVSRCNRCSDWLIHMDNTISEFKYLSYIANERDIESDLTSFTSDCYSEFNLKKIAYRIKDVPFETQSTKNTYSLSLNEKWMYNTGKCVDASPLVASLSDGRMAVFIGSHSHKFSAILFNSGELLWETTLGDRIESSACITLCGEFVVVGCYDYNLYAVNSMNGDIWWKYQTRGEIKSSPVVDPVTSLVIFGSHDQCLHAVDVKLKKKVWCTMIGHGSIFASPCVSSQPHLILCATLGGILAALHGDNGKLLWQFNCRKPIFSSPMLTKHGICVGCVEKKIYHINFQGQETWKYTVEDLVFSSPTVVDDVILIGSNDRHLYCLSMDGYLIWKVKVESAVYSSAFTFTLNYFQQDHDIIKTKTKDVQNNMYFLSNCPKKNSKPEDISFEKSSCNLFEGEQSNKLKTDTLKINTIQKNGKVKKFVTFASTAGNLYIVDFCSGEIILKHFLSGQIFSSPVVYDNCLVVGCRNDFVYCLSIK
ncbi:beta-alanine-activating enzyme-like isoform X2 [Mytilus galloprovincialis]|uniref:beta-alanine-activating enzyme-like isoform X2 n=1 Tax=Mytilus galloprovincialis TaxID=29158 RepID=UPI003F7C61E4